MDNGYRTSVLEEKIRIFEEKIRVIESISQLPSDATNKDIILAINKITASIKRRR